jgi:hypothetical protein
MKRLFTALLLGLMVSSLVGSAALAAPPYGPARPGRFQPAKPTLSPYLDLFRENRGLLPNYHTFVRPKIEQQEFNQQQQLFNDRQLMVNETQRRTNVTIQDSMQQLQQGGGTMRIRPAGGAQTGIGSGFRNFSHFYPGLK